MRVRQRPWDRKAAQRLRGPLSYFCLYIPTAPVCSKCVHHGHAQLIRTRKLQKNDWPLLLELMGPKGVGGGCWCQWWRVEHGGKTWEACKGDTAKRAFRKEIEAGTVNGSLAFVDSECVGWCRYGPVTDFPRLMNSPSLHQEPPPGTWSVVCFYIPAWFRRHGVASALLRHAVGVMRERGVPCIEGYPVSEHSRAGVSVPAGFAWTGVETMFRTAGFRVARQTGGQRKIWRLQPRQ